MNAREAIFQNYPRMCGNPYQHMVFSQFQLNYFASLNSGKNDACFASACSYQNGYPVFEDNFLENDVTNLDDGIQPVQKIITWYEQHGIPFVVLYSASRGFHIHGSFEPELIYPETLKKFNRILLKETNTEGSFDSHTTSDVRRLARIPNTKRVNELWCIPLSVENVFAESASFDILKLSRSPQFLSYKIQKRPRITEFVQNTEPKNNLDIVYHPPPIKGSFFIKDVLRPCVYKKLCSPNPPESIRLTSVIEAFNHGITAEKLFEVFEQFRWVDWNRNYTKYKLQYIEERRKRGELMIPFGKRKLNCQKPGSCFNCIIRGDNND